MINEECVFTKVKCSINLCIAGFFKEFNSNTIYTNIKWVRAVHVYTPRRGL